VDAVAGVEVATVSTVKMCYYRSMKWLQWNPDRNGILGTVIALVVIVCAFAVVVMRFPGYWADAGFGPEWKCVAQVEGDPVCVKKPNR
jgi:hypothetical protein